MTSHIRRRLMMSKDLADLRFYFRLPRIWLPSKPIIRQSTVVKLAIAVASRPFQASM